MIYDIKVKNIDDSYTSLNIYKNNVLLIVNTASSCGFAYQYEQLEKLYQKYKDNNFKVLSFPSNQFNNQEPLDNNQIKEFCSLNHGVTFDIFAKIDVNGKNEDPLFKYLKSKTKGLFTSKIKWNFTKFLIDKEGNVVKRYGPNINPYDIEKDIIKLLK